MRYYTAWLLGVLLLVGPQALADPLCDDSNKPPMCEKGDKVDGPNCVHTVLVKRGPHDEEVPYTTLYRGRGDARMVSWKGVGRLDTSKWEYVVMEQPKGRDHEGYLTWDYVFYRWDGSRYK